MKTPAPITIAEITSEWTELRREVIRREGYALRAGQFGTDLAGEPFSIELKSLTTNDWGAIVLPGGALAFTTAADRDAVLKQLQEG